MAIERPDRFDIKDLFLDVRLDALVDGESIDFTGRRHFSIGFFREGIGFGITDIKIVVDTSLQPIVEVTFIDLYGNTIFGGQFNDKGVDFSSFFRWPPPKFLFTFKGYLGRPVTWMLNLKQYDINFISQNGHYELKATFVPNQWGFFADIPFLYLLAAKRLRMNKGATQEEAMSIFDLIKIGRQVEVKTEEATKKFDVLLKKISSMQADISGALLNSKMVSFGEVITGQVGGQEVDGFKKIEITDITSETTSGFKNLDDVKQKTNGIKGKELVNQYLLCKLRISDKLGPYGGSDWNFDRFSTLPQNTRDTEFKKVLKELENNIFNINEETKASIYDASRVELSQITISEIFRQIAKDSAYVMGRILEAGFKGNSDDPNSDGLTDRYTRRNSDDADARPRLVGKYYPLVDEKGNEVPAIDGVGIADAGCEMDFVQEFIDAIIEGIVQDLLTEDQLSTATTDDRLTARINNLEAMSRNPYRQNYQSIAENIIARSGIAGYMTRSNDPNLPGDYNKGLLGGYIDRDSYEEIAELAKEDAKNITDNMLKSLSDSDKLSLKTFVDFFDKLFTENGEDFLNSEGKAAEFLDQEGTLTLFGYPVNSSVMNYKVVMKIPEGRTAAEFNTQEKIQAALANQTLPNDNCKTVGEMFQQVVSNGSLRGMVDPSMLTSRMMVNNGVIYTYPHNPSDEMFYVVYEGDDARAIKEVNNSKTDSEFNGSTIDKDESEPKGLVEINTYYDENGEDPLGRVEKLNDIIDEGRALSYSKLKSTYLDFNSTGGGFDDNVDYGSFDDTGLPTSLYDLLWRKKIVSQESVIEAGEESVKAKPSDIVYTVLYHKDEPDGFIPVTRLVFGPFLRGTKARNQRIFIKTLCSEVNRKFKDIEIERQATISRVLGKANEQEIILYKQMHSLFHQWSTLAYKDSVSEDGSISGFGLNQNGSGIADELQALYGGYDKHVDLNGKSADDVKNLPDTTFIYDYPLQRIRELSSPGDPVIDVRNSIINLDPLFRPDANTTVLNMLYNLCNKNNFMFIPIPGYAGYLDVKSIYKPYIGNTETRIRNFFHVLFTPTPESRSMISNKTYSAPLTFHDSDTQKDIKGDALSVEFGATHNQIVKNVSVNTRDNKVTAESIINLQRLTDKEDHNKTVTTDCSMLNVMGGRSYTSKVDVLGNSQVYPMQFFFLEKMPLFDGLYQIMKVEHAITPNNMNTSFEGIRMRFNPGSGTGSGYFSIPPITLDVLAKAAEERIKPTEPNVNLASIEGGNIKEGVGTEREGRDFPGLDEIRSRYQNGRIPESELKASRWLKKLDSSNVALLLAEAADAFDRMMDDFSNSNFHWKQKTWVTSSYRSYQKQLLLKQQLGGAAATPGTSNHGWGTAVDFWWGLRISNRNDPKFREAAFAHPNYRWFFENAHRYGWYNPPKLRDGSGLEEWWHWEYHGHNGDPEPLLAQYGKGFNRESVDYILSKGGNTFVA